MWNMDHKYFGAGCVENVKNIINIYVLTKALPASVVYMNAPQEIIMGQPSLWYLYTRKSED